LCGNWGDAFLWQLRDPIVAAELIPICAWLRELNPALRIGLHTNGGARDVRWWEELAGLVDFVRFGIDGSRRRITSTGAGCSGRTCCARCGRFEAPAAGRMGFSRLRHNEHEVEKARELAAELGFARFTVKRTRRFLQRAAERAGRKSGRLRARLNMARRAARGRISQRCGTGSRRRMMAAEDYARYLDETPIACKATALREIYVSAEALVFPCCYLAHIYSGRGSAELDQVRALLAAQPGGRDAIDARRQPLRAIVEGRCFAPSRIPGRQPVGRLAGWRPARVNAGASIYFAAQFAGPRHLIA